MTVDTTITSSSRRWEELLYCKARRWRDALKRAIFRLVSGRACYNIASGFPGRTRSVLGYRTGLDPRMAIRGPRTSCILVG